MNFIKKYSAINEVNDEIKSFRGYPGFIYIFLFNVDFYNSNNYILLPWKGDFFNGFLSFIHGYWSVMFIMANDGIPMLSKCPM